MTLAKDYAGLTIAKIARLYRAKRLSPVELVRYYLERIAKFDKTLNSYVALYERKVLRAAKNVESEFARGRCHSPLHGIPIAVKENIAAKGERTAAGSKILADWLPGHNATCVSKLLDAGAILIGRTNMHEWAKGDTTDNPFFGATHNPWNQERIPGGSSGGSAAAVAASLCTAALGTDNAGSVRMPAAFCGIVGLKPTFGRVSRHGLVPGTGAPTTDHVGIFSRTVEDSAIILNQIAGFDKLDPLSSMEPVPNFLASVRGSVKGMKIAMLGEYFFDIASKEVRRTVEGAMQVFTSLGMTERKVSIPHLKYVGAVRNSFAPEGVLGHEEYLLSRPRDYSPGVLGLLIQGLLQPSIYYAKATHVRRMIADEVEDALHEVDAIITPVTSIPAPKIADCREGFVRIDGRRVATRELKRVDGNLFIRLTIPFNLTGHPTISLPCGFSRDGLPIGFQLTTAYYGEAKLFQVAKAYEDATDWHDRRPYLE